MASTITDFSQYHRMRADAGAGPDADKSAVLREVAGQFEALFVESLLKNMRAISIAGPKVRFAERLSRVVLK